MSTAQERIKNDGKQKEIARSPASHALGLGLTVPPALRRVMSMEDREREQRQALNIVKASQSGNRDRIKTLRRNYSIGQLVSWTEPKDKALDWQVIVEEGKEVVRSDPFMEDFITDNVLRYDSFSEAICDNIARSFETCSTKKDKWLQLFKGCYGPSVYYYSDDSRNDTEKNMSCETMGLLDLAAQVDRDPSSKNCIIPFLYFKGYKSIQAHRMAHVLWRKGRKHAALMVQSRVCELWGVDIHPAALIDTGLMIDHGTGVVVGETAVIGTNCSFLHGVTLGSTGKDDQDRHPKLGNDILVGCGTSILGNIRIGNNTKLGSGSIVLKSMPCCVTAVGNPARIVGRSKCISAARDMDLALVHVLYCKEIQKAVDEDDDQYTKDYSSSINTHLTLCPLTVFKEVDKYSRQKINMDELGTAMGLRFGMTPPQHIMDRLFADTDRDGDGFLTYSEYVEFSWQIITFTAKLPKNDELMNQWLDYVKENDSESVTSMLLAKARLLLDLDDCIHITEASVERKLSEDVDLLTDSHQVGVDMRVMMDTNIADSTSMKQPGTLGHPLSGLSLNSLEESSLELNVLTED